MAFSKTEQNWELLWGSTFQYSLKEDDHNKWTQWKGQELINLLLPVLLDNLFPCKNQHNSVNHKVGTYKLVI